MPAIAFAKITCPACGSHRINIPHDREEKEFAVTCAMCGANLGLWEEIAEDVAPLKERGRPE